VIRTLPRVNIHRRRKRPERKPLLECGLVVSKYVVIDGPKYVLFKEFQDHSPSRAQARLQIDSTNNGLKRVGKNRVFSPPSALLLSYPKTQHLPETAICCDPSQSIHIHHRGTNLRHPSLFQRWKGTEKVLRYHEIEDCIPYELETLVTGHAPFLCRGSMRQGLLN
jgi:hypothetical protein